MGAKRGETSCSARAAMIRGQRPIVFAVTRSAVTAAIRTLAAGAALAVRSKACAGIAMNERTPDKPNERRRRSLGYGASVLVAVVSFVLGPSCLERRDDPGLDSSQTRCAVCHGDPSRAGDYLRRAAPPRDLSGASTSAYPGVGAHSIHLDASNTHGKIACSECHVVPERTDSPGHADSARPAPIVFGALATSLDHTPAYDSVARTC